MESWTLSPTLTIASVSLAYTAWKIISWYDKAKSLPPGPPKLPLIDNLHNIPRGLDWFKFEEFSDTYNSDIIHLGALGKSIVILNSIRTAQDLLEKRSGIYSSRSSSVMLNDLSELNTFSSFNPYGDVWRAYRRMFNKHFGTNSGAINQPREEFYTRRFLGQLIENPSEFRHHIQHLVGSIVISMTYGIKAQADKDPHIEVAETVVVTLGDACVDTYITDIFPIFRHLPTWFPGVKFHKIAANNRRHVSMIRDDLFDAAQKFQKTGDCSPSFLSMATEDPEEDHNLVKKVASEMYMAGSDTTVSSLATLFLAMACYPEVQKKLQAELDEALKGKLPTHDEVDSLPYLNAVIMEVLRWKPPLPLAIPHAVITDDVYEGYHIPKDSIVIPNTWAIRNDPQAYPNPAVFNPERFLKDGKIDTSVLDPADFAFGFGRRVCPGRHIAMSTLKMTIASTMAFFDITKKVDEAGNPIEPCQDYTFSLVTHPKEFNCEIKPRSRQAQDTIEAWVTAEGDNPP